MVSTVNMDNVIEKIAPVYQIEYQSVINNWWVSLEGERVFVCLGSKLGQFHYKPY